MLTAPSQHLLNAGVCAAVQRAAGPHVPHDASRARRTALGVCTRHCRGPRVSSSGSESRGRLGAWADVRAAIRRYQLGSAMTANGAPPRQAQAPHYGAEAAARSSAGVDQRVSDRSVSLHRRCRADGALWSLHIGTRTADGPWRAAAAPGGDGAGAAGAAGATARAKHWRLGARGQWQRWWWWEQAPARRRRSRERRTTTARAVVAAEPVPVSRSRLRVTATCVLYSAPDGPARMHRLCGRSAVASPAGQPFKERTCVMMWCTLRGSLCATPLYVPSRPTVSRPPPCPSLSRPP